MKTCPNCDHPLAVEYDDTEEKWFETFVHEGNMYCRRAFRVLSLGGGTWVATVPEYVDERHGAELVLVLGKGTTAEAAVNDCRNKIQERLGTSARTGTKTE